MQGDLSLPLSWIVRQHTLFTPPRLAFLFPSRASVATRSAQRPWCKLHGRFRVPKPARRGGCRE
jgi:hypothetical protein